MFGFVSLFNDINFHGLFKAKVILRGEEMRDKGVHAFPKSIKENIIERLELKLTYFKAEL